MISEKVPQSVSSKIPQTPVKPGTPLDRSSSCNSVSTVWTLCADCCSCSRAGVVVVVVIDDN